MEVFASALSNIFLQMVNELHIHTSTNGGGYYLKCQPAHWERLGVQCCAQGHFDTW